jgi:hypothetical protein
MQDVIGKKYGLVAVLDNAERRGKNRCVLVRCSCEAKTEKVVLLYSLTSGATTSCGCVRKAQLRARVTTHGLSQHKLYKTWLGMLKRCRNPNYREYAYYGGRGITVCERWKEFENFYNDMFPSYAEGLSLDRLDNDQGYGPENCKWSTVAEQNRNKRSNVNVEINGKIQCLQDWCNEFGLNYKTVQTRIRDGKNPKEALTFKRNDCRAEMLRGKP